MVLGNKKGKRCFLSQYLRFITWEASSRHTLTLLLAHEVTTMNKHEFTQFLPRTMILRKLQKGQFPKLRNLKSFVNELYMDTLKKDGLASVLEGKY